MKTSVISQGVPGRAIFRRPKATPMAFEGKVGRVRGAGGLSPQVSTIRRSKHRRAQRCSDHPRCWPHRLSRCGRSREHAARRQHSCRSSGVTVASLHRRRAAVGHVRHAVDPQRLTRSGHQAAGLAILQAPATASASISTSARPNILLPRRRDQEAARRRSRQSRRLSPIPPSQTPWQEIQRGVVDELSQGMVLKPAVKYQKIHATFGIPRDNH